MSNNMMQNNMVELYGKICNELAYSHEVFGERFYMTYLENKRTSGVLDILPIIISERLGAEKLEVGTRIGIFGHYRSYNQCLEDGRHRLMLSVFAQEIAAGKEVLEGNDINDIYLNGVICKAPVYRKTPLGREIADLLLAVNRSYGKSDYIPCICWGRNARYVSSFESGERIQISGRIQSREYVKKLSETESQTRTAYEVSISRLEIVENEEN